MRYVKELKNTCLLEKSWLQQKIPGQKTFSAIRYFAKSPCNREVWSASSARFLLTHARMQTWPDRELQM